MTTATTFDFARALGRTGAAALNTDIEKQAAAGRVHAVLISTAAAHGLDMPASKAGFAAFSAELLTKDKAKGLPMAIGRALALSCAAVRAIMGLEALTMADWVSPKPAAARKPAAAKAPDAAAVLAAINGGLYDAATLAMFAAAIASEAEIAGNIARGQRIAEAASLA
jgi:hypothetical protein